MVRVQWVALVGSRWLAVGGVSLLACRGQQVRQADLDAWRGVNVAVLERHPVFASMALEKRPLTDGGELWIYSSCATSGGGCTPVSRYDYKSHTFVNAGEVCSGPETVCCSNQFLVSATGVVDEYRPVGKCFTDETLRPVTRAAQ